MLYNANNIKFQIARLTDNDNITVLVEETTDLIYLRFKEGYK